PLQAAERVDSRRAVVTLPPMLALLLATSFATSAAAAQPAGWERTLDRVVPAVVVLRVSAPRSFDTQIASSTTATGFVVDAEQGLILTNRHVVQPGPAVAEAVFLDHEEVELQAVYRDPVHDFGFFRYDPEAVRFMPPTALELAPDRARVGTEVRVVGNDAGEKLSILTGTLARLDRDAPVYGRNGYNDFNTFYLQAGSNTSGGSSGSPVVDRSGRVVALNAGGSSRAASSFYLPLDRVVRALDLIRAGEPVARGTLETTFLHRPFDEVRRLGLRPETEAATRRAFPNAVGMLVVGDIVPGGPADGVLEPGDVVLRMEGRPLMGFLPLESILDESVGMEIELEVERGGEPRQLHVRVGDLHAITPDEYLEVGGGVLHELSYQQARNHALPVRGVYVADPGFAFARADVPRGAVLTAIGGSPTPTLDAAETALAGFADGARVPVRYFRLGNPRTEQVSVLTVDRRWFHMQRCRRDDRLGTWPCVASAPPPAAEDPRATTVQLPSLGEGRLDRLARSLVLVRFHVPYLIDGVPGGRFLGAGLVVDAERGLVVTDRDTVPVSLGDATVSFAGSVELPARVVYLHPVHGLAVLRYDPALIGDTPVRSADLHVRDLSPGDEFWLVGLTPRDRIVSETTRISQVEAPELPLPRPPRFRETGLELVTVSDQPATVGGVLADGRGRVVALWASFSTQRGREAESVFAGIPSELVRDTVAPLREGRTPEWRSLEVELVPVPLAEARSRGLPEAAARLLEESDSGQRRVLSVRRRVAGSPAARLLREGDLLVSVNGQPVTRPREVERAVAGEKVRVRVVREGEELELDVPSVSLTGSGSTRALRWAGALLQAPHRALAAQRGAEPGGVYVSWAWFGSPASRYGLRATRRIVAVDGVPTPDLDAFLSGVADKGDRDSVRLKTVDLEGRVAVITLKLDLRYWPTVELLRSEDGWQRIDRSDSAS
ncbi:MAG: trypsin-like peptidase domain-containing protein, partial [Myxococcota bacterium]